MNEVDNPSAGILDRNLEFNLNQLRQLYSNLATEEMNTATLINVNDISTNTFKPLTVKEITEV